MAEILAFDLEEKRKKRNGCIFRNNPLSIHTREGDKVNFPCIGLYEKKTGVPLLYPGFERWYLNIEEMQATTTMNRKANSIRSFLNFLLWETNCDKVSEVTIDILREFIIDFKETEDEEPRDPDGWRRGIKNVFVFLYEYHLFNETNICFNYDRKDLCIPDQKHKGTKSMNILGIKPPKKIKRKGRYILEDYRNIILKECRIHDPMLVLAVALQSAAGLREGEIVNLTRGSIDFRDGGFGRLDNILIDLEDEAPFAKAYKGKTEFGKIKIKRTAEVYPDFIDEIYQLYKRHEMMLAKLGVPDEPEAPLFVDQWGKPMSVATYKGRLKKVFQNYFVPDLERLARSTGEWAKHAPFIEIWTDHMDPKTGQIIKASYPGAHMFRHWFTMYLLEHTSLGTEMIAKWRGDSTSEAMEDYIHVNARMIDVFKNVVCAFQDEMLEEVINRNG